MTADIAAAFQAQAGLGQGGAEVDAGAGLTVAVGQLVTVLERQRRAEERMYEAIFSRVFPPQAAAIAGAAVSILGPGPQTGFAWAVQRVTVFGLAAADIAGIYRGPAAAAAQSADNLLTVVTGAAPTWHPGRTACILQEGERITIANVGALTASGQVTLTGETIQMEQWLLPHFLL